MLIVNSIYLCFRFRYCFTPFRLLHRLPFSRCCLVCFFFSSSSVHLGLKIVGSMPLNTWLCALHAHRIDMSIRHHIYLCLRHNRLHASQMLMKHIFSEMLLFFILFLRCLSLYVFGRRFFRMSSVAFAHSIFFEM